MKFFSGFGRGVAYFFKGFGFVFNNGLWHYIFFSLLIWLLMWLAAFFFIGELADSIKDWITSVVMLQSIPDEGHWLSWLKAFLNGYLAFLVAWLIRLFLWFISGTFMKYVTLILISPLMSLLSEAVDQKLNGVSYPFKLTQLIKDIFRGIAINLRNMLIEYLLIFAGFILSLMFAPLGFVITPILFFVSWYFYGFSMMDYSCERNKMGVGASVRFIRSNMGIACGIGFCYSLMFILPSFIGSAIGMMFGPVMAVAGATLAFEEIKKKNNVSAAI